MAESAASKSCGEFDIERKASFSDHSSVDHAEEMKDSVPVELGLESPKKQFEE